MTTSPTPHNNPSSSQRKEEPLERAECAFCKRVLNDPCEGEQDMRYCAFRPPTTMGHWGLVHGIWGEYNTTARGFR